MVGITYHSRESLEDGSEHLCQEEHKAMNPNAGVYQHHHQDTEQNQKYRKEMTRKPRYTTVTIAWLTTETLKDQ